MNYLDLSYTVTVLIPQGQNFVTLTGLNVPFNPTDCGAVTEGNYVIWATPDPATLTSNGVTVNLSGATLDGNQTCIVTFYGQTVSPFPAPTATPNPGSQLDRAVVAYLTNQGVGAGGVNVSPADSLGTKSYPSVTVISRNSQHTPMLTGNEEFQVDITCLFSAAGGQQSVNPDGLRVVRDSIIGLVMASMMQSSDNATLDATAALITSAGRALASTGTPQSQQNNADMANFTALHTYYLGSTRGTPDEQGCSWVEIRHFRISVAPTFL